MTLSVVIITQNEEANLGRTLASVQPLVAGGSGEVILVDSGSTDRTVEIAKSFGAKVFIEEWKGFAAQKNSAIDKANGDWILSLDADEELEPALAQAVASAISDKVETNSIAGFWIRRRNSFLGRWIKHGGFWPDPKMRLFRRGSGTFENRAVHEDVRVKGPTSTLGGALIHYSYPTLSDYLDHMNRYSSLGAGMVAANGRFRFSVFKIVLRPLATFVYNYVFRLGFLDGREGLMLHLYHAAYVSWKYAKAWELQKKAASPKLP